MDDEEFIDTVRQEASLESKDTARDVTNGMLQTLGERITDGEASNIARHLPEDFAETLINASQGEAEPFTLEEFTERMSERSAVDDSRIIAHARAVATALSVALEDIETVREQLPSEFDVIFEPSGPITETNFLETVQDRADLDSSEAARDAVTATLRILGERLSEGEAIDVALYLPDAFEDALLASDDKSATNYSFDEFVQRVSQREGVKKENAAVHAQAVCSTLAETASEREISAAKKQLPDPFGMLFEPPNPGEEKT